MNIVAPVTDYIRNSLLTTKGDIVKHNGTTAARLALGAVGKILRVNSAGDDLEYQSPGKFLGDKIDVDQLGSNTDITTAGAALCNIGLGTMAIGEIALVIACIYGQKLTGSGWLQTSIGSGAGTTGTYDWAGGGSPTLNVMIDCTVNNYYGYQMVGLVECQSAGIINLRLSGDVGADKFTAWASGATWLAGFNLSNI